MASVILKDLVKQFKTATAVDRLSIEIQDREFAVLVGPSGCGKTTALRMIAGLEPVTSGEIFIGERRVNDVNPKDRDIAMVFQNYALYPHMSVRENLGFGLKMRKFTRAEIDQRVQEAADILGIHDLLDRRPKQLSGGQRQRVAVGRAIVRKPKVFLFDEPLSNLDAKLRVAMRAEISKLHRRLGATIIYVTHDQVEAMTMANRIFIMNHGRLQQSGAPLEVYRQPANRFVAGFIGSPAMNFMDATLVREAAGFAVDAGGFRLRLPESPPPGAGGLRRAPGRLRRAARGHRGGRRRPRQRRDPARAGRGGGDPRRGDLRPPELRGAHPRRAHRLPGTAAGGRRAAHGGAENGQDPPVRQRDLPHDRVIAPGPR